MYDWKKLNWLFWVISIDYTRFIHSKNIVDIVLYNYILFGHVRLFYNFIL